VVCGLVRNNLKGNRGTRNGNLGTTGKNQSLKDLPLKLEKKGVE